MSIQVKANMTLEFYFLNIDRLCRIMATPLTLESLWRASSTFGTGGP